MKKIESYMQRDLAFQHFTWSIIGITNFVYITVPFDKPDWYESPKSNGGLPDAQIWSLISSQFFVNVIDYLCLNYNAYLAYIRWQKDHQANFIILTQVISWQNMCQ